jgi:magnesium-transporting ATPase (P-type)
LLVGDLVQVDSGMEIPADGLLVLAHDISCDESAMTGLIKILIINIY